MRSHIAWQNEEQTITLIDIPQSIAEAQGFNSLADFELLSSRVRKEPFPIIEPKTAAAKAKLASNTVDNDTEASYRQILTKALTEIEQHHDDRPWCLPRLFVEDDPPPGIKRKLDDSNLDEDRDDHPSGALERAFCKLSGTLKLPDGLIARLARSNSIGWTMSSGEAERISVNVQSEGHFVSNDSGAHESLEYSEPESIDDSHAKSYRFNMPPKSSFYLGACEDGRKFRQAIRAQGSREGLEPWFDFILLDPPWPNRSIKRTHKTAGSTYQTIASMEQLSDMIFDMNLDTLMGDDCLLGIWITNKQAVREAVLGDGGFFDYWDVDLVEEWIWLKTTIKGEPLTTLDSMWKKPYETLLLGRKRYASDVGQRQVSATQRKVIVGVPSLHSQKPCLKSLIEPMMMLPGKALEIFARHLVSGWTSWGDECVKYNWDGFWKPKEQHG